MTVVDDGTSTNEMRLGTVKKIQYVIEKFGLEDDMMVLAGDIVLNFSLTKFLSFCLEKKTSYTMRYWENKRETLPKHGVLEMDEDKVIGMEEKSAEHKTQWCCPPFYYYYSKEDAKRIGGALADGCVYDAPGSFVAWFCKKTYVYAMEMPGSRYDVGNLEN